MSTPALELLSRLRSAQERLDEAVGRLDRHIDGACMELDSPPRSGDSAAAAPTRLVGLPELRCPEPVRAGPAASLVWELERHLEAFEVGDHLVRRGGAGSEESGPARGLSRGGPFDRWGRAMERGAASAAEAPPDRATPASTELPASGIGAALSPAQWEDALRGDAAIDVGEALTEARGSASPPSGAVRDEPSQVALEDAEKSGAVALSALSGSTSDTADREWELQAREGREMEHRVWTRRLELPYAVLVQKYKHAPELGVTERFGRAGLERFAEAIRELVHRAEGVHRVVWRGRLCRVYRGAEHLVVVTPEGRLLTVHRATALQRDYVAAHPEVEP